MRLMKLARVSKRNSTISLRGFNHQRGVNGIKRWQKPLNLLVAPLMELSVPRSIKVIGDYIFGKEGGKIVIRD